MKRKLHLITLFLQPLSCAPTAGLGLFLFYDGCTVFFSSFTAHWSMGYGYPQ